MVQQIIHKPKFSRESRTGFEKMQLSHERTRMEIKRIQTERVKRTETGNRTMSGNPTANKALVPATTINATTSTDATSTAQ